tara:strand:- start:111 stop:842 length:732 start_codon:yes stop_codon:yes gene_type:complete
MNDFYIFGDSFGEDDKSNSPKRWYNILKSSYPQIKINNYCVGCTGPIRNIKHLISLSKSRSKNIIFLLPIKYRIEFPFSKVKDHNEIFKEIYDTKKSPKPEVDYALNWQHEIDLIYDLFNQEIELSSFLCILYLHYYTLRYNCKTLVLLCDPYDKCDENYFFFNNEKFKVHSKNIWEVCEEEFKTRVIDMEIDQHKRSNHLSECNHKIMFNIISNFFMNTHLSETFNQNLYEGTENFSGFIYE